MPNYCTNCGKPLKSNWNVCPYCGASIYSPISPKSITPPKANSVEKNRSYALFNKQLEEDYIVPKKEKKPINKKRIWTIVIVCSIALAGVLTPILIYIANNCFVTIDYYVSHGELSRTYSGLIPRSRYNYYKNQAHPSHATGDWNYAASVIASYCTPGEEELVKIAQEIKSQCINQSDDEEIINALLSFTQGITYKNELRDFAKYPLETLIDRGDCEDLSVFFGSILESLGYEAVILCVLVYDEVEDEWFGHACVGVHLDFVPSHHSYFPPSYYFNATEDSNKYWLCETTAQGWMVGQLAVFDPSYFSIVGYDFVN